LTTARNLLSSPPQLNQDPPAERRRATKRWTPPHTANRWERDTWPETGSDPHLQTTPQERDTSRIKKETVSAKNLGYGHRSNKDEAWGEQTTTKHLARPTGLPPTPPHNKTTHTPNH
jgi:hypothetical protein